MRRLLIWSLAGIASIALTVLMFLPATWMASIVDKQTAGRLTLGDARGTLWRGSAFIGGAAGDNDPVTPLLPGRFSWHISPMLLLGSVNAELENAAALSQAISVTGNWHQWQVSPGAVVLPAQRLAALGAPLNTVQPSGRMLLSWEPLLVTLQNGRIGMTGTIKLEMTDIGSRLSSVNPLGSYELLLAWSGDHASVMLNTVKGPMLLSGSGALGNGRLQFSGTAQADAGQEERLANFLNLLGQSRRVGDKNIVALEFK
ncbi:MAG: General secretion pathway protein GspN [Candidatus Gallionella acididurans]|uniref:Type II secretion system protein N n=1 Tax=Candidatus Gallionella acididurans TaxID=1796491 RepID=A0A139BUY8_9PROT|nr:MAG: General secretion pathway protein GspN [Candidatus Gallionella acididurans]